MRAPQDVALARSPGSSIATPGAAAWVTDFLAAAYFARPERQRSVDDLRLASGILATRWARLDRRLGARDVLAFHRAFGRARLGGGGRLDRDALLDGAAALLGEWFPEAWDDERRRAYGIAFETVAARRAFDPGVRLRHAALRELAGPEREPDEQAWHTYPQTRLRDGAAAWALLRDPARWPDIASAIGRFTPLRRGGLRGQTFEIEVALQALPRAPAWTRGYVTACRVLGGRAAQSYAASLEPFVGPLAAGEVLGAVELVTHRGHFLGRAVSRLLVGGDWIRDVGSWDPLPPGTRAGYLLGGRAAQAAFWGDEDVERSMLQQIALAVA